MNNQNLKKHFESLIKVYLPNIIFSYTIDKKDHFQVKISNYNKPIIVDYFIDNTIFMISFPDNKLYNDFAKKHYDKLSGYDIELAATTCVILFHRMKNLPRIYSDE